jgi:hypothetical protein
MNPIALTAIEGHSHRDDVSNSNIMISIINLPMHKCIILLLFNSKEQNLDERLARFAYFSRKSF